MEVGFATFSEINDHFLDFDWAFYFFDGSFLRSDTLLINKNLKISVELFSFV